MNNLSIGRRLCLCFNLLSLLSLRFVVVDGDMRNTWNIEGPDGKKCLAEGDVDNVSSPDIPVNDTVCESESSVIRLNYTIGKTVEYPKYQIFQKDCKEVFVAGTEPIQGIMSPDDDNTTALSMSPSLDGHDNKIASLELRLTKASLPSFWKALAQRLSNTGQTVEFCIRMGLWLDLGQEKMEVNFRETNVVLTLQKITSDESDHYVVDSLVLDPLKPRSIKVELNLGEL